ncbi:MULTISPECIES: TetR/AcrR family transcriptional regulator [Nocardiaceae]|uniref:TetR/AcrR family transcriptional regulator n=1 Tax=Nocardiaceae TaxID=85025 RepID=UPI00352FF6D4
MTPATPAKPGSTRRRPPGRSGPRQDPQRDTRLLDAAVELLAEGGFAHLTMDRAALRAGVGKATVYRRWASPAELAAEAFEHSGIINEQAIVTIGPGRLRDELIGTLVATATCSSPRPRHGLVATMLETTRLHPEVTAAIQQRYLSNLFDSAMTVLRRAQERGDLGASLPRDGSPPMPIEAAIALILQWQIVRQHEISENDIERIVDELVLPALAR